MIPRFSIVLNDIEPVILLAKAAGALAGSLVSIAYILPRGRREAWLRLAVGVVAGFVFGTTAGLKIANTLGVLNHLSAVEVALMGSTLASLCAWWGLGVLHRIAEAAPGYAELWLNAKKPSQSRKDR